MLVVGLCLACCLLFVVGSLFVVHCFGVWRFVIGGWRLAVGVSCLLFLRFALRVCCVLLSVLCSTLCVEFHGLLVVLRFVFLFVLG